MAITADIKSGWGALKSHWLFFAILIFLLVLLAVGYDKKNGTFSSWRAKLATFPLIGPLFATFAILVGASWVFHAVRAALVASIGVG